MERNARRAGGPPRASQVPESATNRPPGGPVGTGGHPESAGGSMPRKGRKMGRQEPACGGLLSHFPRALSSSAECGEPPSADSSIRHWHRTWRLPRLQRACPSTALDERVLTRSVNQISPPASTGTGTRGGWWQWPAGPGAGPFLRGSCNPLRKGPASGRLRRNWWRSGFAARWSVPGVNREPHSDPNFGTMRTEGGRLR